MTNDNPWVAAHVDAEVVYQRHFGRHARAVAERLVALENMGAPEPLPCDCGGTAHFRATVGVRMCPDCRAMYHGNGDRVGGQR
jgi:hypothetical protein